MEVATSISRFRACTARGSRLHTRPRVPILAAHATRLVTRRANNVSRSLPNCLTAKRSTPTISHSILNRCSTRSSFVARIRCIASECEIPSDAPPHAVPRDSLELRGQSQVVSEKLWASLWQTARVLSYSCACYFALAAVQCGVAMATGGLMGVASPPPAPKVNLAEVSTQLLFSLALLVAIGFFSLAESAITTLWPWKVRELADKEGDGSPFKVLQKDITRFLTTILIGSTVSGIAATALVTDAAFKIAGEVGVGYATVALTFGMLIFCEIAPKSIAVIHAAPIARFIIPSISFLSVILYPIGVISKKITAVILSILRIDASTEPFVTEEELKLVLNGAAKSGAVLEKESEMIARVLGLEDTPVREIMTPLVEVVAVEETSTLDHMREIWRKHQYSRVPVFRGRIDNVVGIMYCYDMLQFTKQEKLDEVLVGQMAQRPPFFVPENMSVWNLLKEFRLRKSHMAVVVNEYGGTIGICTMEDAVEEIVGDIYDENDKYITKQNIVPRGNGIFDVDAKTELDELREVLKLDFTEGPYETVSGYVMAQFGCIPEVFQSMEVTLTPLKTGYEAEKEGGEDWGNSGHEAPKVLMRLTVTEGTNRQIHSVRLEQLSKDGLPVVGDPPPPPITLPSQQFLPPPFSDVSLDSEMSASSAASSAGTLPFSSTSEGDDASMDGDLPKSSYDEALVPEMSASSAGTLPFSSPSVGDDAPMDGDLPKSSYDEALLPEMSASSAGILPFSSPSVGDDAPMDGDLSKSSLTSIKHESN